MQIRQYILILRAGWWIILAVLLVTSGAGLAYSYAQAPTYEAAATFVVNPSVRIAETYDLLYSIDTLAGRTSLATTYANILKSRQVIDSAAASLGLSPDSLAEYDINAVVLPDSNVLLLQVQGPSAYLAADLANSIGTSGLEYISKLQAVYELRRLDAALVELKPVSPDHVTNITLSVALGLLGGVSLVILRQVLLQLFGEEQTFVLETVPVLSEN
jgi:succinoglycan biosynthesis transport protein ExoP